MASEICALCQQIAGLRNSHIIPNSVFRRIKRQQGSGQLVRFDDWDGTLVDRSQESWSERLLCGGCEQIVSDYEKYGLTLLRNAEWPSENAPGRFMVIRNHDYAKFKLFLTSIVWRAAVSKQPVFAKAKLPPQIAEEARLSIILGRPLQHLRLGCKISRLIDSTGHDSSFSVENLRDLITSPIPRLRDGEPRYSLLFLLEGFALEFFVPAVAFRIASAGGVHRDVPNFFVPLKCVFQVPELVKLMVAGYGKHLRGDASIG